MKVFFNFKYNFANVFRKKSFFFFPNSFFLKGLLFSFFLLLFSSLSCDKVTKPTTVTFSGTVILEGETDQSGVKVMLFRPIAIDTALTNLNTKYPGVGIEINQRTEFFWREQSPKYTTTTNANGTWTIEKVEPGKYHIVAQADSFGWKVAYNADAGSNDITLTKAIQWSGTYNQGVVIPAGSFVEIVGNTTFIIGSQVTIEPGVIVEFQNNSTLELQGTVLCNGIKENEIYFVSEDTANSNRIRLTQSNNSIIDRSCFLNIKSGIYITTSDSIKIINCRFKNAQYAFELFNSTEAHVEKNVISNVTEGLVTQETELMLLKNLIIYITMNGIKSSSAKNSLVQNNVVQNCRENGLGINYGGYAYTNTFLNITENDFISNKTHVYVGQNGKCTANFNNFLNENSFIVNTVPIAYADTLNFQNNYWNVFNPIEISNKINDGEDWQTPNLIGPIIDFSNFLFQRVNWEIND